MPRISAPTVAEHRARRRSEILDTAGELFASHGILGTDLGDIAERVGLTRTAMYRYFPDRDHLFVAWADRLHAHIADRVDAHLTPYEDPLERLAAWITFQLDHVAGPDHAVGRRVMPELGALPPDLREHVLDVHRRLQAKVLPTLEEIVGDRKRASLVLQFVGAVVQSGAIAMESGAMRDEVEPLIRAAVDALLQRQVSHDQVRRAGRQR